STLLFTGHDTTTNALAWYLYEIARNPESRERVRAEIAIIRAKKGSEGLLATDFESMEYTLATVKVYRTHYPIVHTMFREATSTQDDVIPLSSPIVTKSGEKVSSIPVRKRTPVDVAIGIWGADANEFNPERFLRIDKSKHLDIAICIIAGGSSGCIGWRFAVLRTILEMWTIIVTLIENFEFSVPPQIETTRIYRKPIGTMMAPMVEGRPGAWMGLVLKSLEE
ncbi:cytochrome P450, partial [Lactarius psammicola]